MVTRRSAVAAASVSRSDSMVSVSMLMAYLRLSLPPSSRPDLEPTQLGIEVFLLCRRRRLLGGGVDLVVAVEERIPLDEWNGHVRVLLGRGDGRQRSEVCGEVLLRVAVEHGVVEFVCEDDFAHCVELEQAVEDLEPLPGLLGDVRPVLRVDSKGRVVLARERIGLELPDRFEEPLWVDAAGRLRR